MIFEVKLNQKKKLEFETLNFMDIKRFGEVIGLSHNNQANEKHLEEILSSMIGESIFQDYLVFGRERRYQKEADIFAINEDGDLVIFELKVNGQYDRSKLLQIMDYAAIFSKWGYKEIHEHYQKSNKTTDEFYQKFKDKFPDGISKNKFNRRQKMIIISNSSEKSISSAVEYWKRQGIEIEEYFYRFYKIDNQFLFEITTDNFAPEDSQNAWINTNLKYDKDAYKDMIKNHKASAYGDRANTITDNMKNGYIFLYHNGCGIIGAGIGTNQIINQVTNGEEEKYIKLKNFIHGCNDDGKIIKYINPKELKKLLDQDFYFANTKISLDKLKSEKLYEKCLNIFQ
ncbi:hypothetical protein H3N56_10980 [Cetobacterium sp. 2A]|uniref:hypothetical protein n=1 Tax=Cetobacterium sp. 2A TaxID=2754723 RepID=UPI00163BFE27|nr:hypothetical protein [Cetobacterium sp. 2A]MBC2856957.1 hypothetical protein [Cetobacterium sp. 2A]